MNKWSYFLKTSVFNNTFACSNQVYWAKTRYTCRNTCFLLKKNQIMCIFACFKQNNTFHKKKWSYFIKTSMSNNTFACSDHVLVLNHYTHVETRVYHQIVCILVCFKQNNTFCKETLFMKKNRSYLLKTSILIPHLLVLTTHLVLHHYSPAEIRVFHHIVCICPVCLPLISITTPQILLLCGMPQDSPLHHVISIFNNLTHPNHLAFQYDELHLPIFCQIYESINTFLHLITPSFDLPFHKA